MSSSSSAFTRRTPVTATYGRRRPAPSTPITPTAASPVRNSRRSVTMDEQARPVSSKGDDDILDSITVESPISSGRVRGGGMTGLTGQTARLDVSSSFVTTPSKPPNRDGPAKRKRRSATEILQPSVDEELIPDAGDIFAFSDSESTMTPTRKHRTPSGKTRGQKQISGQSARQATSGATSPLTSVETRPIIPLKPSPFKIVVPITRPPAQSPAVVIPPVEPPPAPSTAASPISTSTRRPISPPPLEDLEFDYPPPASPTPRTPSSTGSPSKWQHSPRLTSRQSEAWKALDQVAGSVSASKGTHMGISGSSGSGKLFKLLAARKDSGSTSSGASLRIKETTQSASSHEQGEDEDGVQSAVDSQDTQHTETQSQGQSFTSQLTRSGKITYGPQRSYLDETTIATDTSGKPTSISDLTDAELLKSGMLGSSSSSSNYQSQRQRRSILRRNSSSEDEDARGEGELSSLKSIHELRASGVNAKFIDEMEYLLDGLHRDSRPSAVRLTYLELALKLTDKSFVIKFKAGGFLDRIFTNIKDLTTSGVDDVTSFAMAYIVCCFLNDEGVVKSLVHEYGVASFLLGIARDGREITIVAKQKGLALSKVAQSLVKDLRDKIVSLIPNDADMRPETVSRRLVALAGLLELSSKYSARHENIQEELSSNSLWQVILGCVRDILESGDTNQMRVVAAHELHLCVSILEDFAPSVIAKEHASEYDETETCAVVQRLLELIPQIIDTPAETVSLATIRLSIIMTNSSSEACAILCIDRVVNGLEICIERVLLETRPEDSDTQPDDEGNQDAPDDDDDGEHYGVAANVALFCLGLLVNFGESESAREVLAGASHVATFNRLFNLATSTNVKSLAECASPKKTYIDDIRGYLALMLGILIRFSNAVRTQIGVAGVAALASELEIFRESTLRLQNEPGMAGSRGLAEQIMSVLTDVYAK
ncbi:wings apart-like protein regulation of heterochromatin-domain-containing protein [Lipomyces kononenkoae]|uniref:Wings apart-like protein regulation of heterochromatin-domain-containing protein n=1 Tax=Lipomyces kononenkoae TaxID=34357 RepID=A0ACC3SXZ1_LIPKO